MSFNQWSSKGKKGWKNSGQGGKSNGFGKAKGGWEGSGGDGDGWDSGKGGWGNGHSAWEGGKASWAGKKGVQKGGKEDWGTQAETNYSKRIVSKDALVKKIMKTYPDEDLNCLVGGTITATKDGLRQWVDATSSEIIRRPPFGLSMAVNGIMALAEATKADASDDLSRFLESEEGTQLVSLAKTLQYSKIKEAPRRATKDLEAFFTSLKKT